VVGGFTEFITDTLCRGAWSQRWKGGGYMKKLVLIYVKRERGSKFTWDDNGKKRVLFIRGGRRNG
jgi:hypothetical protein